MPMVTCTYCAGSGEVSTGQTDNRGRPIYGPCPRCHGSGRVWVDRPLGGPPLPRRRR